MPAETPNESSSIGPIRVRINPDALRGARKTAGMSVRQLAAASGVSPAAVHRAEQPRGATRYTRPIATVEAIADALGLPAAAITDS